MTQNQERYDGVEDSVLLRTLTWRTNQHILQGDTREGGEILLETLEDLLNDVSSMDPVEHYSGLADIKRAMSERRLQRAEVVDQIATTFTMERTTIEQIVSTSEVINTRLTDRFIDELKRLRRAGSPVPTIELSDGTEMICGKTLKSLLLLSLQARACLTASEASALLFQGHVYGSYGRTRSLYELAVVIGVLAEDETYEICERYQASAVYEVLKDLEHEERQARFYGESFASSDELSEAQSTAKAIEERYGHELRYPHGWARPLFHDRRKRVSFYDLEERLGISEALRANYHSMNHAIHAGPASTISYTDFSIRQLNATRPLVDDPNDIRVIATNIAFFLRLGSEATARSLASELTAHDHLILVGLLRGFTARL